MASLHLTRSLFLRSVALCYTMAFLSLYPQIEGLYGARGILPAKPTLDGLPDITDSKIPLTNFRAFLSKLNPNLLKFIPEYLGLSVDFSMDLICLVGTFLSVVTSFSKSWANKFNFMVLWLCYFSLYSVGQTFLWFQWDILLLEIGFLCVVVAPLWNGNAKTRPWDKMNLFLVKWLLFRMMFSSGVVKLLSKCPAWWGLTAMPLHYESQCLPTWLAWYAYQMPTVVHKLSVIVTYVIEIPLTLWFFAPTKNLRQFTFWMQVMLMVNIMLTGNYNFFNFLYTSLCVCLLDDTWLHGHESVYRKSRNFLFTVLRWIFNSFMYIGLGMALKHYFLKNSELAINFSQNELKRFVEFVGTESVTLAFAIYLYLSLVSLYECLASYGRLFSKLVHIATVVFHTGLGLTLIAISVPVFLRGMGVNKQPPILPVWTTSLATDLDHLQITNSYGLFRSMTGIGGRPEVIVEGSNSRSGPWLEYHFKYKPGKLDGAPKFLLPHQPRLDWQMWFAALGSYQHNLWFLSLMYRLLENESSVINLIQENPFQTSPPKFVRAKLYHYHFTESMDSKHYWRREFVREYLPEVGKENLVQVMINANVLNGEGKNHIDICSNKKLESFLRRLRNLTKKIPDHYLAQSTLLCLISVPKFLV